MSATSKLSHVVCALFLFTATCLEPVQAHGSLDELLEHFSQLISGEPDDYKNLLDRAKIQLRRGNKELAFNDIRAAAEISDETEVAYVLGLYHIAGNNQQAAVAAFSTYLARYPEHIPSIHNRAKCHNALGLTAQSVSDYEHLLNTSKQHSPDYYLELARVQSSIETDGIDQALKSLDRGMEKLGILVSLQNEAIQLEINRENYRKAMARHETLKPWLGKTTPWLLRLKQLSEKLAAEANQATSIMF